MSRLAKLISKTLKELKVRKKVNEYNWESETDEDGWDVITYYSDSSDGKETRERIEKLNTLNKDIQKEKEI